MQQLLCIGNTSYDITAYLENYPVENVKYMTQDFNECAGGPAANASCLASSWGLPAAFIGVTGDDIYADLIERDLSSFGVDCSGIIRRKGTKTPLSIITVNLENGSRTLVNRNRLEQVGRSSGFSLDRYSPSVILFDGYELDTALEAIEKFPEASTVLDAGSLRRETEALASRVDHLVCSERFACSVSGISDIREKKDYAKAYDSLMELNGRNVVITMGEHGMVYQSGGKVKKADAFRVKAVDTTGAGDIYHGAFAWCLAQGMGMDETVIFSAAASALSVQKRGGLTSIPSLEETWALFRTRGQGC